MVEALLLQISAICARFRALPRLVVILWLLTQPVLLAQPIAPEQVAPVEAVFDQLAGPAGAARARIRLITDNEVAWFARWRLVEEAQKTIDCTYYIVADDVFGKSFLGLLYKKAKSGVRIRLMIDARGSANLARRIHEQALLRELCGVPTVSIRVYNPVSHALLQAFRDPRLLVACNHDKLLITDGTWLLTGGRNISAGYLTGQADNPHSYRDTDILIHGGDAANRAQVAFEREFEKSSNYTIRATGFFGGRAERSLELELARRVMQAHMSNDPALDAAGPSLLKNFQAEVSGFPGLKGYRAYTPFGGHRPYPVLLLDKLSIVKPQVEKLNEITPAVVKLIDATREEIVIQNPYVVLTPVCQKALGRATARGVRIVVHTNSPESCDTFVTQALFVREWKSYLRDFPTMRLFVVKGERLLHAKVFVLDRKIAVIGSYNMDAVSEEINSEEVVAVRSREFALLAALGIEKDLAGALEYKIRVLPGGQVQQVVGPSDHCDRGSVSLLKMLGNVMRFVQSLF